MFEEIGKLILEKTKTKMTMIMGIFLNLHSELKKVYTILISKLRLITENFL